MNSEHSDKLKSLLSKANGGWTISASEGKARSGCSELIIATSMDNGQMGFFYDFYMSASGPAGLRPSAARWIQGRHPGSIRSGTCPRPHRLVKIAHASPFFHRFSTTCQRKGAAFGH
jgi:hypothetical protein